jgi:hypothetical protein
MFERFFRKQEPDGYRHIEVTDKTDYTRRLRTVTVRCPLEYPGLTEVERRKMYEGLALIADAFRAADARAEASYTLGKYKKGNKK